MENIMKDTAVFDLDGTLLNTLDDLMDSVNFALEKCGFKVRSYEEVRAFVGNGVRLLVERAVPSGTSKSDADRVFKEFTAHYDKNMENKTRPYDGVKELLAALKARGIKTAIVSNKYDSAVKQLAKKLFGDMIDIAVGESETVAKKPAPDGVLAALASLGSIGTNAVYIGDSDVDAETAKNAKIDFIGVTWGFRDRSLLETFPHVAIVDKTEEILTVFE